MTALDPSLEPPERKDFRRVNRGVPLVMNADTGKWDRYKRASSAGNILDDDSNLVDWSKRVIVVGAAQRPDLMAMASVLSVDANKNELRDIAEECLVSGKGTQRANTGTAIHAMLDHVDLDHDWTPAPQFRDAVQAYVDALDLFGLVPVDVEAQCVNDTYRIAGTMDRRYRTTRNLVNPNGEIIPIGSIVGADTKTGQSLEYAAGSYATQLAAYTHPDTVRYDTATNERTPFDPPTYQDFAIIVHMDANDGRCDMYWVDLEAGRFALDLSERVREWRKRTDLIVPAHPPLRAVPEVITESDNEPINVVIPIADVIHEIDASLRAAADRHPSAEPLARPPVAPQAPLAAVVGPPAPTRPLGAGDAPADHVSPSTDLPKRDPERQSTTDVVDAVRAWLRDRIGRIREAGEAPTAKLLRDWPMGVPGLRHNTQTEAELDAVSEVVWNVEKEFSLPFPTPDPRTPQVENHNFSTRWAKPTGDDTPTDATSAMEFRLQLDKHPRKALLRAWAELALTNALPTITDRWALTHALYEFAMLPLDEWSDDDVTEMLDGTLRAIGYDDGVYSLGHVIAEHAPLIMSSAFAITAGNALLLYDDKGNPVVRTIN